MEIVEPEEDVEVVEAEEEIGDPKPYHIAVQIPPSQTEFDLATSMAASLTAAAYVSIAGDVNEGEWDSSNGGYLGRNRRAPLTYAENGRRSVRIGTDHQALLPACVSGVEGPRLG